VRFAEQNDTDREIESFDWSQCYWQKLEHHVTLFCCGICKDIFSFRSHPHHLRRSSFFFFFFFLNIRFLVKLNLMED